MTDTEWLTESRKLHRYIRDARANAKAAPTRAERVTWQREVKHWEEKLRLHRLPASDKVAV